MGSAYVSSGVGADRCGATHVASALSAPETADQASRPLHLGDVAPAFTTAEQAELSTWSATLARFGLQAVVTSSYPLLTEALAIFAGTADEPRWLLHRTPHGAFAVRQWPGVAEIVASLADALAIIDATCEAVAAHGARPTLADAAPHLQPA